VNCLPRSKRRSLLGVSARELAARAVRARAGFTLIELMVVVLIVSILCVLAIPTLSHEGYERRAFTDAASVSELVREGRTRAIARGIAQLIVMSANSTANTASFVLYEAYASSANDGGLASAIAYSSCNAPTVWPGGAGVTASIVDAFQIAPSSASGQTVEATGNINMRVNDPTGGADIGATNSLYLCFTPAGRTYYAIVSNGTAPPASFTTVTSTSGPLSSLGANASGGSPVGAITVDVTIGAFPSSTTGATSSSNLIRTVWIPPSGATRITSQ
jgi:prepilin-type N-terminal cleavage/methylation domain-containing protein